MIFLPRSTSTKRLIASNLIFLAALQWGCDATSSSIKRGNEIAEVPSEEQLSKPTSIANLKVKAMMVELPAVMHLAWALGYVYPFGCEDKNGHSELRDMMSDPSKFPTEFEQIEKYVTIHNEVDDDGYIKSTTLIPNQGSCNLAPTQIEFNSWRVDLDGYDVIEELGASGGSNKSSTRSLLGFDADSAMSSDLTVSTDACETNELELEDSEEKESDWSVSVSSGISFIGSAKVTTSYGGSVSSENSTTNKTKEENCTTSTVDASISVSEGDTVLQVTDNHVSKKIQKVNAHIKVSYGIKIKGHLRWKQGGGNNYIPEHKVHEWLEYQFGGQSSGLHYLDAVSKQVNENNGINKQVWNWESITDKNGNFRWAYDRAFKWSGELDVERSSSIEKQITTNKNLTNVFICKRNASSQTVSGQSAQGSANNSDLSELDQKCLEAFKQYDEEQS
jgi:hypothetical protein